jgi:preprotein translocase subunit SecG
MYQVIIVVHVLLGLGVVGLVLMQQGKGADAGAAFGSGSSGSVFGAQGAASFLSRATAILATLFFMTSLGLAILNGKQGAAYDLMNAPKVEQDTLGMPDIGGAKGAVGVAPVIDQKAEEIPVASPESEPLIKKK